jgi:hypothetical protein
MITRASLRLNRLAGGASTSPCTSPRQPVGGGKSPKAAAALSPKAAAPPPCDEDENFATQCPVCYNLLCEPVTLPSCHHSFCLNCLSKVERFAKPQAEQEGCVLKCPLCRHAHTTPVAWLPVDAELDHKVRTAGTEGEYVERREQAAAERRVWQEEEEDSREGGTFVVSGCSIPDVNGEYTAARLRWYVGPVPYVNAHGYSLFRWERRFWVISDQDSGDTMGDTSGWLFVAPTSDTQVTPAKTGWQPGAAAFEPGVAPPDVPLSVPEVRRLRVPQRLRDGEEPAVEADMEAEMEAEMDHHAGNAQADGAPGADDEHDDDMPEPTDSAESTMASMADVPAGTLAGMRAAAAAAFDGLGPLFAFEQTQDSDAEDVDVEVDAAADADADPHMI